ncbi:unnamed protein product [Mycena citricolor]|uniref:Retrotransposon gag domain-containing protein n=1 Tax=Mycena citricolor TaxID=2018698 RepID=A0AAD2K070_9AGAR|nr:unnamed protein product [Mycena citricolor]
MSYMEEEDHGSSPEQRLGNLEEAMQRIEGLLNNFIIEQQQPAPVPAPSPAVGPGVFTGQQASSRPLIRPNPPFAFDGDRTQGKTFLHSVKQYWRLLPEAFHVNGVVSEERVVRFALSYMSKDSAASWSERMSERLVFPFPTWSSFVAEFKLRLTNYSEWRTRAFRQYNAEVAARAARGQAFSPHRAPPPVAPRPRPVAAPSSHRAFPWRSTEPEPAPVFVAPASDAAAQDTWPETARPPLMSGTLTSWTK